MELPEKINATYILESLKDLVEQNDVLVSDLGLLAG